MMKRVMIFPLALCAAVRGPGAPGTCEAACRVKAKVVEQVVETQVVAVPLAVAVGVPVAQTTPYYYSYAAYANSGGQAAVDLDALAAKIADRLRTASPPPADGSNQNPQSIPTPQPPTSAPTGGSAAKMSVGSIVQQRCIVCHSGADAKGKLSLETPAALDPASRLKAIRAVLSEKMPKDGPRLTPEEAGRALEELAGE